MRGGADVAVLPEDVPSGAIRYELDGGELRIAGPPDVTHARIQTEIGDYLCEHGEQPGYGRASMSVAVILSRNPDTVFVPDATFVLNRSLPVRTSVEDYLETNPELLVEIRGRNDGLAELYAKAERYLHAGVQIVWVVDPAAKTVTVYRPGESLQNLREDDPLTAKGVIPGFKVPVAEPFSE